MKKELISDILFGWEKDISSGAGHNHRDSVAKVIIGICQPKWISVKDGLPENNQKISFKTITEREGIFIEGLGFYDREGNYYEKEEVLNWEPREKDAETGDVPQIKEWGSKGSPF